MYLDVKYSVWQRLYLNEIATESNVVDILYKNQEKVKLGIIPPQINGMVSKSDVLYETEIILPAEEDATVELYNDEQKCIWKNI